MPRFDGGWLTEAVWCVIALWFARLPFGWLVHLMHRFWLHRYHTQK